MADNLAMAADLIGQTARCSWYFSLRMLAGRRAAALGDTTSYKPAGPVPTTRDLLTDLAALVLDDANAVRDGLYPLAGRRAAALGDTTSYKPAGPVPTTRDLLTDLAALVLDDANAVRDGLYPLAESRLSSLGGHIGRVRQMLDDLPRAVEQRQRRDATSAGKQPLAQGLPDYFTQDFHFQDGGYLTQNSARLYDVQVDTLFMGATHVMRRAALRPMANFCLGRDQRRLSLLDVACGTGRSLREYRLAYPAMQMTGVDLSKPYLDEAASFLNGLRRVDLRHGNAESLPLPDASQDIVTMSYLFHELPPDVRRVVTGEVARVLKPGGLFLFIDSLQMGDRPEWDGMLEAFPQRYHEPYYRSYVIDDLALMFAASGLRLESERNVFLSKLMALRKT